MTPTRRRLLTASIGLSIPFASHGAPRRGLTFAANAGMFQELYEPAVVAPFERAHADIDVFYYGVPSSTQTLATLRRQREHPEIDVALLDVATARIASDEGLLEPIRADSLPVLSELAPAATFPGLAGPAVFTEPLVLLYDTAQVPAPTTWRSLWSGIGDRSIAIPAPPETAGIAFTVVAGRLFGGGNDDRAFMGGVNAIAALSRRVLSWDPRPDVYHMVGDGNAKYGVGWNMQAQVFADRMEGRLGVAFPDEGTVSRVTTVNLVKGARQADAARLFIAWLLGVDAQKAMVEKMYLGPVNAKARYLQSVLSRTANTPARAANAMPVDWVFVEQIREPMIKRWRETVPGAG